MFRLNAKWLAWIVAVGLIVQPLQASFGPLVSAQSLSSATHGATGVFRCQALGMASPLGIFRLRVRHAVFLLALLASFLPEFSSAQANRHVSDEKDKSRAEDTLDFALGEVGRAALAWVEDHVRNAFAHAYIQRHPKAAVKMEDPNNPDADLHPFVAGRRLDDYKTGDPAEVFSVYSTMVLSSEEKYLSPDQKALRKKLEEHLKRVQERDPARMSDKELESAAHKLKGYQPDYAAQVERLFYITELAKRQHAEDVAGISAKGFPAKIAPNSEKVFLFYLSGFRTDALHVSKQAALIHAVKVRNIGTEQNRGTGIFDLWVWDIAIDIVGEPAGVDVLESLPGIDHATAVRLNEKGYGDLHTLSAILSGNSDVTVDKLVELGLPKDTAKQKQILSGANAHMHTELPLNLDLESRYARPAKRLTFYLHNKNTLDFLMFPELGDRHSWIKLPPFSQSPDTWGPFDKTYAKESDELQPSSFIFNFIKENPFARNRNPLRASA